MAVLWRAVLPIEVRDEREILLATGRFLVDKTGYQQLLTYVRQWPARVWSVEGAKGVGRPLAARLLADGETVWDVPAKLAAGCGCSTPDMAARPTPPTRTQWPWWRCAPAGYASWFSIRT